MSSLRPNLCCISNRTKQKQTQNQNSFVVPQTGKCVCHCSQGKEHYKKTITIVKRNNIIKKVTNLYIHIDVILSLKINSVAVNVNF